VTVAAHADGSPAGLYLLSPSTLELVPPRGFMDLKEQWLGRVLAEGLPVWVHQIPSGSCTPIRTRQDYLRAVLPGIADTDAARTEPAFEPRILGETSQAGSLVCRGALVDREAILVDSVVLPGGVIESGAIVIRSVVCADARVPAGRTVVDSVYGPRGQVADPITHSAESPA